MDFVVVDDASVRNAVKGMLNSIGLRTETFESPGDFIRYSSEPVHDQVLLDGGSGALLEADAKR